MLRSAPVSGQAVRITEIGARARRLVTAPTGVPGLVAALSRSTYLDVAGEIVWLGPPGSTLHARAMIADTERVDASTGRVPILDVSRARVWAPTALPSGITPAALGGAARELTRALGPLGSPEGFGALLAGARPVFPLDRAADDARVFLMTCADGRPAAATALAERLLGLGPGLTPAGDDLVGGAFFARHVLTNAGAADAESWRAAAAAIRTCATTRTHRISAALLGDLLDGDAYAPLHELALALALGDGGRARDAAARLVRIGHSSGWDLLAGFLGALGAADEAPRSG